MTTKTAQFTPGPWKVTGEELVTVGDQELFHRIVRDENERWTALVEIEDREGEANAALIAAAPAMYEALSHAAMSYHHPACKCKGEYSANPELYCTCHVQKARAALAQAEGKHD